MGRLNIRLLGSFQVDIAATPITKFESNKVRALLAYLVIESSQTHSREKLVALFWPEMPAKRASSNLSQALYSLRHLLQDHQENPPFLLRTREAVQFNRESDYWLDIEQFNQNLVQDQPLVTSNDGYHETLESAIDLYRGDFLESLTFDSSLNFDEWVFVQRQRFQRQVLDGLHQLAAYYRERNELPKALSFAWRQVELDPIDERAYRQLMKLLAASDQRNQALKKFDRLRVMLTEELNVLPEPETVRLRDQIRGEKPSLIQDKPRDNLPAFLTPLIGRQQELAEIRGLCRNPACRLLTILGPGGSGKTRLALEVAAISQENFQHGVFFVSLNPVQSPESILPAIAAALDLPKSEQDNHQTQLGNYLRKKDLLLVLDGFEHLVEGGGFIAEILRQSPGIKILMTSRIRLNIKGEQLFLLAGMRYPEEVTSESEIQEADAVQLLIAGLRRTRPDYEPTPEDLSHLLHISQNVLGMPLGILLAASWGATLSIEDIAGMVSQDLIFLTADWTDVPARQRSLRATFDYTWNLLGESEQSIFQSLSVFRGAFTRKAARVICEASPHELRTLVDRSMLWSKTPGWYEVHELLRQFGREKLEELAQVKQDVCNRHSEYYLGQLARLENDLKSAQQIIALRSIDLEHENYRASWNWAASQGAVTQIAQVLDSLCLYYEHSIRYSDGESACQTVGEKLSQEPESDDVELLQARNFFWQSRFSRLLGQPDVASQLMEKSLACLENAKSAGYKAHNVEALILLEQGNTHFHKDRSTAAACYSKALELYRSQDDSWGSAKTLARLGFIAHHAGDFETAVDIYAECLDLNRKLGDPRGIANALIESGQNLLRLGLVKQGEQNINEGVAVLRQIGDQAGVARGYFELCRYYFWSGEFERSCKTNEKSISLFENLGILDFFVLSSIGLGLGLSHLGKYAEAKFEANKGIPVAQELNARREIGLAYVILGMAYLGQMDFEQAEKWAGKSVEQYRKLNQQEELGLALSILVYTQVRLNQSQQARLYLLEILQIGIDIHGVYPILYILFAAALLLIERDQVEKAIELSALANRYPFVENSCWFKDIAGREIDAAADTLPSEVAAAAQKRGQARDIWETAAGLLEDFQSKG